MARDGVDGAAVPAWGAGTALREHFADIVAAYEGPIAGYLYGMVHDAEAARTLTQDTFLAAYHALPGQPVTDLRAWLFRIATHHALTHLQGRPQPLLRRLAAALQHGPGGAPGVAPPLAALARLDPRDRACLLLKASGFQTAIIAAQLGCAPATVRARLYRARVTFRRLYHPAAPGEEL